MKIIEILPEYFDEFTNYIYEEWKQHYKNIDDVKTFYKNLYKKGTKTYIYIKHDGELIGFYTLMKHNRKVYLCDLYIKQKFRKRGLGKKLVNHAIKTINEYDNKCKLLYITTEKQNVVFYLKLGFEIIEEKNNMYNMVYTLQKNEYIFLYILCILSAIILLWWIIKR